MIFIGKIVNTKGLDGEIKILSSSDFKDTRFKKKEKIYILENEEYKEFEIVKSYSHKNFEIIKLKGLNNINDVIQYKGRKIYGKQLTYENLNEGEYFFKDLIGLKVYEDKFIGEVLEALDYGNKTYIRIKKDNGNKILFPFNSEFIKEVDLNKKIINIKTIPGLLDD